MTASREPQQLPADEAPTIRLRVVPAPAPAARPQRSAIRRIARKILGPNLLTKRD